MKRIFLFPLFILFSPAIALASYGEDEKSKIAFSEKGLTKSIYIADSLVSERILIEPIIVLRPKYEFGTESGSSRFTLRNSRIGIQGNVTDNLSYRFLVDLSDNGEFRVLDLYASYGFSDRFLITFGQQSLSLFNPYTTSPNKLDFVNRPFLAKYFLSSRDIGASVKYIIKKEGFPIALEAGVYNGDGINNPEWTKSPAFGGRVSFGSMDGFRTTAKIYKSEVAHNEDYLYWGIDARYENSRFKFETEFMAKENSADIEGVKNLYAVYAQTLYKIYLASGSVKAINPCFRWDAMGYNIQNSGFGINRITIGANMVFNTPIGSTVLKLNYEHYFKQTQDLNALFGSEQNKESKLSVELLLSF